MIKRIGHRRHWRLICSIAVMGGVLAGAPVNAKKAKPTGAVPTAPDYAKPDTWLALPGQNGLERSTPPGFTAIDEKTAPADVFFIHPTTYLKNDVDNAPYPQSPAVAEYNGAVLLGQVSIFNGCCRMYAPRYRQTSVAALSKTAASGIAYGDVAEAFRYYLKHYNKGRPFIIASHSQGTQHAAILLQREILGKPIQKKLVAAYLIGGYVPQSFAQIGLPVCDAPKQTGCVVSHNAARKGSSLAAYAIKDKAYWWQGEIIDRDQAPAVCVNPLNWRIEGPATAASNKGSLPFPKMPFPAHAAPLPPLIPTLTGASCVDGLLEVSLAKPEPVGFKDKLSTLLGSYHRNDYGLFYANMRENAIERVQAWKASAQTGKVGTP